MKPVYMHGENAYIIVGQKPVNHGLNNQFPSITQRLNNLTKKTDITTDGKGINEIKVNIIKPSDTNTNEL